MSAAVSAPWFSILSDVSANLDEMTSLPSADMLRLHPPHIDASREFHPFGLRGVGSEPSWHSSTSEQDPLPPCSDKQEKRLPNVADWKGTLSLITGMTGVAADRRNDLKEQAGTHQRGLEDLRRQVHEAQQRLQTSEIQAHELQLQADSRLQQVQADLDAQVKKVRAEMEARELTISARNDGLIRAAREQVRAAELRAQTAEEWLQRVDAATKNLLLSGHMNRASGRRNR